MLCKIFQMAKPQELLAWLQAVWITDSDGYQGSSHHIWWPFLIIKWVCCRCKGRIQPDLLQGQCFGGFQVSHKELTTEGIFFLWIMDFHLKLRDGCQGIILASVLKNPNSVLASLVLCRVNELVGSNQACLTNNNKHDNLEGVFSMWHLDILAVYMQQFEVPYVMHCGNSDGIDT